MATSTPDRAASRPSSRGALSESPALEPLDPRLYSKLRSLVADPGHRFVVSFGGGSVPGLCGNIALAAILEELDLRPFVAEIWGTSAGAAVGGPWATGTGASAILDTVVGMDPKRAFDLSWPRLVMSLAFSMLGGPLPDGLIQGRHFREAVERALAVRTFEACEIPFHCIACTDDGQLQRKVFRKGDLLSAIFASMSLPGIILPGPAQEGEACRYYDGGLVEKTPLLSPISQHLRRGDPRRLVLLCTHYGNDAARTSAIGFINRFLQSIFALENLVWDYQLAEAHARSQVTLMVLNPRLDDPRLFDFKRVSANYRQARAAFAGTLQNAQIGRASGQ